MSGGTPLPLSYDPFGGPYYGYFISVQANDGLANSARPTLIAFAAASVTNETPIDLAVFVTLPEGSVLSV